MRGILEHCKNDLVKFTIISITTVHCKNDLVKFTIISIPTVVVKPLLSDVNSKHHYSWCCDDISDKNMQ